MEGVVQGVIGQFCTRWALCSPSVLVERLDEALTLGITDDWPFSPSLAGRPLSAGRGSGCRCSTLGRYTFWQAPKMRIYQPLLHGLILSATFLLSAPNNSWAQNARSTLKEAEQEKKRIKALIADLSDDIDTIESDLQTVEEQVRSLETQLNLKQQELAQLEGRLDAERVGTD